MNLDRKLVELTPLSGMTAVNAAALVAFAFSPYAVEYPLAMLGIAVFLVTPFVLPACQLNAETPLCPGNLSQLFFWCQLVLVPVVIGYFGVSLGTLPWLPSSGAMSTAICLRVVGYLTFCAAFQMFHGSARSSGKNDETSQVGAARDIPWLVILGFAVVGMFGWMLHFGGVAGFLELATSPTVQREREIEETTLTGAAGGILRHFLGFAIVWSWSVWIVRTKSPRLVGTIAATAAVVALLIVANFTYNRGTLLAPILALAAAFSVHVRRLSFGFVTLAAGVVLAGAFAAGSYRSTNLQISDLTEGYVSVNWDEDELVSSVQIYGAGPQLTAFLVDELEMSNRSYHGSTLLPSILYPVPVLGKGFREHSGVYLFNEMIYGDPTVLDQNLAYDAELYMNLNYLGVILGYFALGWLQCFLQSRFQQAESPIESYLWLLVGVWASFPGSLSVFSQLCIYTFWPLYGYLFAKFMLRPRLEASLPRDPFAVKGLATS